MPADTEPLIHYFETVAEAASRCAAELRKGVAAPAAPPQLPPGVFLGPRERQVLAYFQQLGPRIWRTARQVVEAIGGDQADIYFPLNTLPSKGLLIKSVEEGEPSKRRKQVWCLPTPEEQSALRATLDDLRL